MLEADASIGVVVEMGMVVMMGNRASLSTWAAQCSHYRYYVNT